MLERACRKRDTLALLVGTQIDTATVEDCKGILILGFFFFLAWPISFFSIQIILEQKLEFLRFSWSYEETYPYSNHSEFDSNDNYVRKILDQVN